MPPLDPTANLPGPGPGRPAGLANSKANGYSHKDFVGALRKNDMQPVDEMCALYRDPGTPARTKFEILKELLQYLYPKRRSIEVKGDVEHRNLNVSWNIDASPSTTVDASKPIVDLPPD